MLKELKEIEDRVVSTVLLSVKASGLPVEQIGIEDDLVSYGVNSMIFIRMAVAFEKEFGIQFDESELDFSKYPNLKTVAAYIASKLIGLADAK